MHRTKRAFSLAELVLVVVIIGLVAAIAVPRLSRAAEATQQAALKRNVAAVRDAIERYYAEHGKYPGYTPGTNSVEHAKFIEQLTQFTDGQGNPSDVYGTPYVYGPYLRKQFPKNPWNGKKNVYVKLDPGASDPPAGSAGWIAVLTTGQFGVFATAQQRTDLIDKGLDPDAVDDLLLRAGL